MAGPRVSVVTPVHNTGAYLAECIESVLRQTFADLEYVIINNVSTDNSLDIARSYAARDRRIRIVNTGKLLPQVANYNFALRQISPHSEFCKMVQADDWLYPDCLQEMVRVAQSDGQVGLVGAMVQNGPNKILGNFPLDCEVVDGREAARQRLLHPREVFSGNPTEMMYRSSVVRGRRRFFQEGRLFEDPEACFEILRDWKYGFVRQTLSFTRTENESVLSRLSKVDMQWWRGSDVILLLRYGKSLLSPAEMSDMETTWIFPYLGSLIETLLDRPMPTAYLEFHGRIWRESGLTPEHVIRWLHAEGQDLVQRQSAALREVPRLFGYPRCAIRQYLELRARCCLLGLVRSPNWIKYRILSALQRGMLDEVKACQLGIRH